MPREYKRTDRIADFIRRELAMLLQQELRDPRLKPVSVTEVVVSRDMSLAKIYVTLMGVDESEDIDSSLDVLNHAAGFMRSALAAKNSMRSTPKLRFYYDETVRRGEKLSQLIDKAVATGRSGEQ